MRKKDKNNVFSPSQWDDTPYFDFFLDVWVRYGFFNKGDIDFILEKNNFINYKTNFKNMECSNMTFPWPERI